MATTVKDSVISVRLEAALLERLDELAAEMDRSRSYLVTEAVRELVEREYAHLEAVREGESDLAAGRSVPQEKVAAWVSDLRGGKARRPPLAR